VAVEDGPMVEEGDGVVGPGDDLRVKVTGSDPADDVACVGSRGHSAIL
jgi:hypothetical protein